MEAIKNFFVNERMLKKLNSTEIVLISKVKGPKNVSQFKPISLRKLLTKLYQR